MHKIVSMVVALTATALFSGVGLALVHEATAEQIAEQFLKNKQLPAVEKVFPSAGNDLLTDRRDFAVGEEQKVLFPARESAGGEPVGLAFEVASAGYGGSVGVMVGFDLTKTALAGVAITTHSETPGVGARAATEPDFGDQFRGLPLDATFRVKQDGGAVDAISGASVTSRAVCDAVTKAVSFYQEHGEAMRETVLSAAPERGGEE